MFNQAGDKNSNYKTILVVEDDYTSIELYKEIFSFFKTVHVMYTKYGKEAIELFTSCRVNLVILDIKLPDIDGIEVLEFVKSISSVPVIVQTAHTKHLYFYRAKQAGCDEYIAKPINIGETIALINKYMK